MKLWRVLNASGTQKICEVPAFYARCHSTRKPITKKNFRLVRMEKARKQSSKQPGIAWSYTTNGLL
jgi:hypothetical protein